MIELRVANKVFKYFSNVDVSLGIDTIASTFSFSGLFNINDQDLKKVFKPFSYQSCEVWMKDDENEINEKLITGIILNPALSSQRQERLSGLSGYSKTGLFQDINIPLDLYPLQMDGLSIQEIATRLCKRFKIQLFVYENAKEDANKPIEKVKAQPSENIKDFLAKLCRDRNMTLSHDNLGRLVIYKILNQTAPKIKINEDDESVVSISVNPNGQGVHSTITVIKQSSTNDQNEALTTIYSPFVSNQDRPLVKMLPTGDGQDTKKFANAIASAEAKAFPINIELEGWTFQNKIVRAGFYIELTAPKLFIQTTKLVIQRINFKSDPKKGKTQSITAVLPCVYTGELPAKSPFI